MAHNIIEVQTSYHDHRLLLQQYHYLGLANISVVIKLYLKTFEPFT